MTKEEVDDLIYASEYRSASRSRKNEFMIDLRTRRLICRVCKLKFALMGFVAENAFGDKKWLGEIRLSRN